MLAGKAVYQCLFTFAFPQLAPSPTQVAKDICFIFSAQPTLEMSTNVQPTLNTLKSSRRRSFLGATGLVAKSLTKVVDLPGLREPVRAAQDIATALKAPKNNDTKAQELIDRIEDILAQTKPSPGGTEYEELKKYRPGLFVAIGKLEAIKVEFLDTKSKNRRTKLARQQEIEQFLNKKEHELHMAIQDLCIQSAIAPTYPPRFPRYVGQFFQALDKCTYLDTLYNYPLLFFFEPSLN
ncbi:hypothetical protein ACGC1H_001239 [Rhizoctonia solani]